MEKKEKEYSFLSTFGTVVYIGGIFAVMLAMASIIFSTVLGVH
jgi:ABC-type amino acid transport system permease subunit